MTLLVSSTPTIDHSSKQASQTSSTMRSLIPLVLALSHLLSSTTAYPGLSQTLSEIQARAVNSSSHSDFLQERATSLLGDLATSITTPVGTTIASILSSTLSAIAPPDGSGPTYKAPGPIGSEPCNKDKLCVWKYVSDDLASTFAGCSDLARAAIRLGFHDAATWDISSPYGGADGSIVLSGNNGELSRFENSGLARVAAYIQGLYAKYAISSPKSKPGMADIIQLAANVATVVCPGGPRIQTFAGRKDDPRPGPTGKLPSPVASAESLIALFQAKTFTAADLVALLGAHSVSKQSFFDPGRAGLPQDSTPAAWDTKYYGETLSTGLADARIVVFPSDKNIATYPGTSGAWNGFVGAGGQGRWAAVSSFLILYFPFALSLFILHVVTSPMAG